MTLYNHACTFGFSLTTNLADGGAVSVADLRRAIVTRLAGLNDTELAENVGCPFDSYRIDPSPRHPTPASTAEGEP